MVSTRTKPKAPSLISSLLKNHDYHSQRSRFHKMNYHHNGRQDLQSSESHSYFSQSSGEKLNRPRWPITKLVDKTFNQVQITLTPHKHQRRSSTKKHHYMSDKTFNQVEIKPKIISSTTLLHTRPPKSCLHIDKVLLHSLSNISLSQLIHTTTSNGALHKQRQHTLTCTQGKIFINEGKTCALKRNNNFQSLQDICG